MPWFAPPDDVADELTDRHVRAIDCPDCEQAGHYCAFHEGYREGVITLLLKAMAE